MEKAFAYFYMSALFIFSLLFMTNCIRDMFCSVKGKGKIIKKPLKQAINVVGKSTTAFLAPLIPEVIKPIMSEELEVEMKSEAETEPDINSDEVETNLNAPFMPDDEFEQYPADDTYLSQGLSFEQISHAVDVVQGKKSGEDEAIIAGETLTLMPDDFLNTICAQAENEAMVKRLIACYVDSMGKVKTKPVGIRDFDINKYI